MSSDGLQAALTATYPQRDGALPSWLDTAAAKIWRSLRRHVVPGASVRAIAARVDAAADELLAADPGRLEAALAAVRAELRRDGLTDAAVTKSFALVRAATQQTLDLRHHDVQLYGAWHLAHGRFIEMATGEGKTVTAALAAATAALAGIPVHVITVNDYLAARDAGTLAPLYDALGLTVGVIQAGMAPKARRGAYRADITFCSNQEIVFDYLRDRVAMGAAGSDLELAVGAGSDALTLRGLCFAIVDEADSVLIDEARTPAILARVAGRDDDIKTYRQLIALARKMRRDDEFRLFGAEKRIELSERGSRRAEAFFKRNENPALKLKRKRNHLVTLALAAVHCYARDRDYLVADDSVQIIDPNTGRAMPDRSWEFGLHQLVEVKEGCPPTDRQETLARITYQRFFRRYLRLSGMTGTAREVANEIHSVYGADVQRVPTHAPVARIDVGEQVFVDPAKRMQMLVSRVRTLYGARRPVLIGTRSVAESDAISAALTAAKLPHQVLNARQDKDEAAVVAAAGQRGAITVATNMAGRGTDIKLGDGVAALGGLHVIATGRNDARRIDRQLFGRAGRQGDPGSVEALVVLDDSFEDSRWAAPVQRLAGALSDPLPRGPGSALVRFAQWCTERRHARARHDLLRHDGQLAKALAFTGRLE